MDHRRNAYFYQRRYLIHKEIETKYELLSFKEAIIHLLLWQVPSRLLNRIKS